jgi:hypothetical protein
LFIPLTFYIICPILNDDIDQFLCGMPRDDGSLSLLSTEDTRVLLLGRQYITDLQAKMAFAWLNKEAVLANCLTPSACSARRNDAPVASSTDMQGH